MPQTSLSSLLHSWELNTYLYVISNTMYKDRGVSLFFSILYHHSQQPVSELPMPWGKCLLSQWHSLYLRITCTRGQQQKEWWDFLQYGDFSISLVFISHNICCGTGIVYCPWILCIATFTHVLHREGEQNSLKHQKYFIFALQAPAGPLPYIPHWNTLWKIVKC